MVLIVLMEIALMSSESFELLISLNKMLIAMNDCVVDLLNSFIIKYTNLFKTI